MTFFIQTLMLSTIYDVFGIEVSEFFTESAGQNLRRVYSGPLCFSTQEYLR